MIPSTTTTTTTTTTRACRIEERPSTIWQKLKSSSSLMLFRIKRSYLWLTGSTTMVLLRYGYICCDRGQRSRPSVNIVGDVLTMSRRQPDDVIKPLLLRFRIVQNDTWYLRIDRSFSHFCMPSSSIIYLTVSNNTKARRQRALECETSYSKIGQPIQISEKFRNESAVRSFCISFINRAVLACFDQAREEIFLSQKSCSSLSVQP